MVWEVVDVEEGDRQRAVAEGLLEVEGLQAVGHRVWDRLEENGPNL